MTPETLATATSRDYLTSALGSMKLANKVLAKFSPEDDEALFDKETLSGFVQLLTESRDKAELCYQVAIQKGHKEGGNDKNPALTGLITSQPHNDNAIIGQSLIATLNEYVNVMQFIIMMFERIKLADNEHILNCIEVQGLHNILLTTQAAIEHAFEQCEVE